MCFAALKWVQLNPSSAHDCSCDFVLIPAPLTLSFSIFNMKELVVPASQGGYKLQRKR